MTTTIRFVARAVSAQVALSQVRCDLPLLYIKEAKKDSEKEQVLLLENFNFGETVLLERGTRSYDEQHRQFVSTNTEVVSNIC